MIPCELFRQAGKLPAMIRLFLLSSLYFFMATALAEENEVIPLYQVEVIVFQHLNSNEVAEKVNQVNDYRMVTRPLPLPDEDEDDINLQSLPETAAQDSVTQGLLMQPLDDLAFWPPGVFDDADFQFGPQTEPEEDLIYEISGPSETMQQAWNRLQNNSAYEPLHYAGWQQHAYAPEQQEPVRIHDDIVLAERGVEQPPETEMQKAGENLPASQSPVPVTELSFTISDIEETEPEALAVDVDSDSGEQEEIDEAEFTSYRLDGQFSLLQRKFLHLVIDIEWRDLATVPAIFEYDADEIAPGYLLFSLLQRRQVHEDRLEYFDTPLLGVLARVTEVELPAEPEQPGTAEEYNAQDADAGSATEDR